MLMLLLLMLLLLLLGILRIKVALCLSFFLVCVKLGRLCNNPSSKYGKEIQIQVILLQLLLLLLLLLIVHHSWCVLLMLWLNASCWPDFTGFSLLPFLVKLSQVSKIFRYTSLRNHVKDLVRDVRARHYRVREEQYR